MEFTFIFLEIFFLGLGLITPLLLFLALLIIVFGQIAGAREGWPRLDSLYWSFITATTVGYGDIRPKAPLSRVLSVLIALTGIIFTGIIVALAIHAATTAFSDKADFAKTEAHLTQE